MADWTKATLADRALEVMGVLASGQTANTEDSTRVEEIADSVYGRLRSEGLAPFALDTIPPWAQIPLRDIVALEAAPLFGITGQKKADTVFNANRGNLELRKQVASKRNPAPVRARYY